MKLLLPSMFLLLSISFFGAQTPPTAEDTLAKAHMYMERDHPDEAIALLQ
ncbi:MAG: hypothetical protein ABSA54_19905 [Terriglobales bacterium]|jgi:hypothetical protein